MLDSFFKPKSVAVIGASREEGKTGHSILANLINNKLVPAGPPSNGSIGGSKRGFPGQIFPVNPKASELLGLKTFPSLEKIDDTIDLAVIVIPPKFIPPALDDCAKKNIKAAIIISAGFKETGAEGARLEKEVALKAKELGIRLLGPNCLGLIDTNSNLNASFAKGMPPQGKIAFFSQSGALCTAILDWAIGSNVGFSKFISLGNKADLSEIDLLEYLANDDETSVILGYLEGIENGSIFMGVAKEAVKKKPVVLIKAGGTGAGARAASSHTGTLAGSDKAFHAAFLQTGIIRAMSIEELFDYAILFAEQPLPRGSRLAIITNAGGPGIIAADAVENTKGIELAQFSSDTLDNLRQKLPPTAGLFNPVDVIGDAKSDRYKDALDIVLKDNNVDAGLVLLTPQAMTDVDIIAQVVAQASENCNKTMVTSFMGEVSVRDAIHLLQEHGIPNYPYPERAVRSFARMARYVETLNLPDDKPVAFNIDKGGVASILKKIIDAGKTTLLDEAKAIIEAYGFKTPQTILAETSDEAVKAAEKLGYPVAMKIASPDIIHKTEVSGVNVGIKDKKEIKNAFLEMTSKAKRHMPNAIIFGVHIQKMVKGKEVILGVSRDRSFGPLIMFGLGGIYVEVMKDVAFRVAPLLRRDVESMLEEVKGFPILKGVRGEKKSDINALIDAILRLSQLVTDFPEIIEMDINPLMVLPEGEGVVAVDVRMGVGSR
ncbi:MAG: acetate--CoA ligase family protein [Deltaproteobacteria bacterium]|nr:acetate--CoA ligase family protein [Deltaproteobacteria bacterium]